MKSVRWILVLVLGAIVSPVVPAEAAVLEVSWTAPTTNADGSALRDLSGYRLYLGTATPACRSASYHTVASPTAAPAANQRVSTTIAGLNAGSTYLVRVSAVDRNGNEGGCTATVSSVARGALSVSPSSAVTFGSVPPGGSVDRTFTVQNTTGSTVSGGVSVGSPFAIVSGGSFSLAAGASRSVVVRFQPSGAGSFATNVNFTAGGDTISRGVSGSATGSSSGSSTTPRLTISRSGSGSGTVTSTPSGISCGSDCTQSYTAGARVTLTARAASGSRFTGWSGGGCSGTGTCSVTVNGAIGVTAGFSPATSSPPDLAVTSFVMPSVVTRNTGFPISFNVVNLGASAGQVQLHVVLSRDNRPSTDDVLLYTRTYSSIAAGATLRSAITKSLPSATRTGSHYVMVIVDGARRIQEPNESNNGVMKAITIR